MEDSLSYPRNARSNAPHEPAEQCGASPIYLAESCPELSQSANTWPPNFFSLYGALAGDRSFIEPADAPLGSTPAF